MPARKPKYSTAPFTEKTAAFVDWLTDKKARDIVAFDLTRENSLSEAVVIATANSVRHGQGLAEHLLKSAREHNYEYLRMEGAPVGQWILLDFNDVVVHLFLPDIRRLFKLDELWPKAPVLADTRTREDT